MSGLGAKIKEVLGVGTEHSAETERGEVDHRTPGSFPAEITPDDSTHTGHERNKLHKKDDPRGQAPTEGLAHTDAAPGVTGHHDDTPAHTGLEGNTNTAQYEHQDAKEIPIRSEPDAMKSNIEDVPSFPAAVAHDHHKTGESQLPEGNLPSHTHDAPTTHIKDNTTGAVHDTQAQSHSDGNGGTAAFFHSGPTSKDKAEDVVTTGHDGEVGSVPNVSETTHASTTQAPTSEGKPYWGDLPHGAGVYNTVIGHGSNRDDESHSHPLGHHGAGTEAAPGKDTAAQDQLTQASEHQHTSESSKPHDQITPFNSSRTAQSAPVLAHTTETSHPEPVEKDQPSQLHKNQEHTTTEASHPKSEEKDGKKHGILGFLHKDKDNSESNKQSAKDTEQKDTKHSGGILHQHEEKHHEEKRHETSKEPAQKHEKTKEGGLFHHHKDESESKPTEHNAPLPVSDNHRQFQESSPPHGGRSDLPSTTNTTENVPRDNDSKFGSGLAAASGGAALGAGIVAAHNRQDEKKDEHTSRSQHDTSFAQGHTGTAQHVEPPAHATHQTHFDQLSHDSTAKDDQSFKPDLLAESRGLPLTSGTGVAVLGGTAPTTHGQDGHAAESHHAVPHSHEQPRSSEFQSTSNASHSNQGHQSSFVTNDDGGAYNKLNDGTSSGIAVGHSSTGESQRSGQNTSQYQALSNDPIAQSESTDTNKHTGLSAAAVGAGGLAAVAGHNNPESDYKNQYLSNQEGNTKKLDDESRSGVATSHTSKHETHSHEHDNIHYKTSGKEHVSEPEPSNTKRDAAVAGTAVAAGTGLAAHQRQGDDGTTTTGQDGSSRFEPASSGPKEQAQIPRTYAADNQEASVQSGGNDDAAEYNTLGSGTVSGVRLGGPHDHHHHS